MKVEIHSHTNVYSECSRIVPSELIRMAEAAGYDALFITDHNKVWSPRELAGIREFCEHLRVLPGIEIALPSGDDILVLGADNPIYESLRTPGEVFAQACADGYLTVLAHPFRFRDRIDETCALADAVEVFTCNHASPPMAAAARAYAKAHNMAELYGSDAHGLNFMNRFWIETHDAFQTPQELRRLVLSGQYTNRARSADVALPPTYKAATMAELTEDELSHLALRPANLTRRGRARL